MEKGNFTFCLLASTLASKFIYLIGTTSPCCYEQQLLQVSKVDQGQQLSVPLLLPPDCWLHWYTMGEGSEAGNGVWTAVGMTETALQETDFDESAQLYSRL